MIEFFNMNESFNNLKIIHLDKLFLCGKILL